MTASTDIIEQSTKKQAIGIALFAALLALSITPIQKIDVKEDILHAIKEEIQPYGGNVSVISEVEHDKGEGKKSNNNPEIYLGKGEGHLYPVDESSRNDDSEEDSSDDSDDPDDSSDPESSDDEDWSSSGDELELWDDESLKVILNGIDDEDSREEIYDWIREEAEEKGNLDPEEWYNFSYWQLHAYFSCSRVMAGSRQIYTSEKWSDIRQYWQEFVEEDRRDLPDGEPELVEHRSYQFSTDVLFDFPVEAFQTLEKGRGLRAARDIAKGEIVFKATNNTVIFTQGHHWRKFLFELNERHGEPFDDETACDVLVWSWVQTLEEKLVIVTDFDNTSLLNEGRDDHPEYESPNVQCGADDGICLFEYYATKDIKRGEELLCDYRGFAELSAWHHMGL